MARHRDIRNMDFEDEYDGYDDIYGHSVDDDYYISPSNRQFIYHRDNSQSSRNGEFVQTEGNIQEEDEVEHELTDIEKAQLESCLHQVKSTLGTVNLSRSELVNLILRFKYNAELVLNAILEDPKLQEKPVEKKDKDVTVKSPLKFNIPKFGIKSNIHDNITLKNRSNFNIPKISFNANTPTNFKQNSPSKGFIIPKLNTTQNLSNKIELSVENTEYNTLSELVSSHLSKELSPNVQNLPNTKLLNKFEQLKISVPSAENTSKKTQSLTNSSINSDPHIIDLSKALLRNTSSLPNMTNMGSKSSLKKSATEKFEIPFIDSKRIDVSNDILQLHPQRDILVCTLDISDILKSQSKYYKKKSNFGKIICEKYKCNRPKIERRKPLSLCQIKIFDFKVPSPDDHIKSNINRR